jgi:hypothetical protein
MIDETRALLAAHGLPCHWILDEDATPADLDDRLVARGMTRLEDTECLVLPLEPDVHEAVFPAGVELIDGLRAASVLIEAEAVLAAAFGEPPLPEAALLRRFHEAASDPDLHLAVALVDGRMAGAGWTAVRPGGVLSVGSAVHPDFRGGSVYRALMAERVRLALEAGAAGCATPGTAATGRILARQGYRPVGRWRRFADTEADPAPG